METKDYIVKLTSKDRLSLDGSISINVLKRGGHVVETKNKGCDVDTDCIVFTPEKPKLSNHIAYEKNKYNGTNIPYRMYISSNLSTADCMFCNCVNVTEIDVSRFDTSNITNMKKMFYGCDNLKHIDLSNWDTSNVTNFNLMFDYCNNLERIDGIIDLSGLKNKKDVTSDDFDIMFDCPNLKGVKLRNVPDWWFSNRRWNNYTALGYKWAGLELDQFEVVE